MLSAIVFSVMFFALVSTDTDPATGPLVGSSYATNSDSEAAQDCGHCHSEYTDPFDPQSLIHQFTDDEPAFSFCGGIAGHPIHDCDNGDGSSWAPGPCHPPCGMALAEVLRLTGGSTIISPAHAVTLQAAYPGLVSYSKATGLLVVRDCAGSIAGVKMAGSFGPAFTGTQL